MSKLIQESAINKLNGIVRAVPINLSKNSIFFANILSTIHVFAII